MPVVTLTKQNSVTRDTFIDQLAPTVANGSSTTLTIGSAASANSAKRPLIFFDLGLIPNDAIINSATLKLNYGSGGGNRQVNVHKITSAWDANTTWNTAPTFDSIVATSFPFPNSSSPASADIKNIVQDWVNGTSANHGILLKDADESVLSTARTFCSLDHSTVANQPTLTIDYTIPTTGKKQVEYVGVTSKSSSVTSTSIAGVLPTGIQAGDLLVAMITMGAYAAVTPPAGWNQEYSFNYSGGQYLFTKVAGVGELNPTFTAASSVAWCASVVAFRNVKQIKQKTGTTINSRTAYFPPDLTSDVTDLMLVTLHSASVNGGTFTPPLSFTEVLDDNGDASVAMQHEIAYRYLHNKMSVISTDMTSTLSTSAAGASYGLMLEPITNNPPTLTLTSPADNLTLVEGNAYQIVGSASDADAGDVVTVKFKIDGGTTYNITAAVSDGSTPINFNKTLGYLNSRLYDGQTPITPILDDQVPHTLTVWAEDDKGGKSADAVRNFTVLYNQPPQISGSDQDLGSIATPPSIQYSVTDAEHYSFTVTEKVGDVTIRSFTGTDGQQETLTIPNDIWITLQPDVTHNLTITATDQYGASSTRTYTFKRTVDGIELETRTPLPADAQPYRMVLTLNAQYPQNAVVNVQVCNNGYDASPTWEDATSAVLNKRPYVFTNTSKTAENWGIKIKISILPGA